SRIGSCSQSGKRSYEKKEPESSHIGSWTKFIQPPATSVLERRAPISRPMAAKAAAPSAAATRRAATLPWIRVPKTSQPKPTRAASSATRNVEREKKYESKK